MTALAGTDLLVRQALRRDRMMLAIWLYAFAAFVAATVYGFRKLYPTDAGRAEFAAVANGNPALLSIYGPFYGSSLGSFTAWRDTTVCAVLAAIMSIFLVVRHTRAEEESGRLELVGSTPIGRHAPLASALLIAAGADLASGAMMAVVAVAFGLPTAGSVALGAGVAGCGLVFAGAATLTAQLSQTARAARGLAVGVLGAAFILRAVGDSVSASGPRWLSWLSPVGWAQLIRSFGSAVAPVTCVQTTPTQLPAGSMICPADQGTRWWTLALPAAAALILAAAAVVVAARRDYGTGLLAQRRGRATAGNLLASPLALAWRLQRSAVVSWVSGAFVFGVVLGSASRGIKGLLTSAQVRRAVAEMGGGSGLTDAYLAAVMGIAGLVVAGFGVSAVLRLRAEETSQRADPVLATAVSRVAWSVSHLVIAASGVIAILAVAGLGAAVGVGTRSESGAGVVSLVGAGLAQAPAALVIAAVAAVLFGIAPRFAVIGGWTALGVVVMVFFLGSVVRLPQWLLDLSPFTHVPKLPGGAAAPLPLVTLSLVATVLAAAGLVGVARRDIG